MFLYRQANQVRKFQIVVVFQVKSYCIIVQASKMSPKMSNSTCFTKSNPNIFLCRQGKQAIKFQIVVVLPSQILMYYCVGKHSEPKNVKQYKVKSLCIIVLASIVSPKMSNSTKSNPNIFLIRRAKIISNSIAFQSQIQLYLCVGEQSKPENF